MSGRTRAKLISLLFFIITGCLVLLPGSAGTAIHPPISEARTSPPNPHGKDDSLKLGLHGSGAQGHREGQGDLSASSVKANALLGGTCINCHVGITPAHTKAALKCTDCHGGNDKVETGPNPNIRDKGLMNQAHVRPKDARFFYANGIDDTFAGAPGKGVTEFDAFNNNLDSLDNNNLVGTHVDQEYNRDLNYVRFINPSDYRVAMISCGSESPASDSNVSCHGTIVETVRKSIMATNQGQFATATYANHSPQGATNDLPQGNNPTGRKDPRDGEVTITFNYDDIDASYNPATNSFDSNRLRALSQNNSDQFDNGFEAIGAPIVDKDGQTATVRHESSTLAPFPPTNRLRGIGGRQIISQAVPRAQKMLLSWSRRDSLVTPDDPTSSLFKVVLNVFGFDNIQGHHPVDAGFNAVRAFDPGLFPDVNQNFPFPFDNNNAVSILANGLNESRRSDVAVNNVEFVPPNPFNRNRNSGCASCHMLYRADGHNEEPFDKTIKENGRQITTDTVTGQREDKGERGYPAIHQLTTKIPTSQCGICHVFTTRVDVAFKGSFEVENNNFNFRWSTTAADVTFSDDGKKKINIPLQFTNNRGTKVNMFDNFTTTDKNGVVILDAAKEHGSGEDASEDLNNNGRLDPGEDKNNNQMLDIPDRLQRSDAQDGRQMRIMYGGATGAVRLMDIHLEKGMECVDCHFYQDLHGDGNIYTRNWDTIEIECQDCHGTAKKLATLETSGPNGGNDLTKSFDENGTPFFEIRSDGSRIQRSRVRDGLSWRIPQVKEAITRGNEHFNQDAFESMGQRSADNRKEFAHINKSRQKGTLECYTCHNAATPQCFACHYSQDYFPKIVSGERLKTDGTLRRNDQQQMEIWMGEKFVPFPNFFFFGIVRSPFLLGTNGDTEFNKLSPFRSIMQLNVSVGGPNGDTLVENTSFTATTHDLVTGDRPRSGSTLNPYMPHTVRLKETKDCDVCHTLRDNNGDIVNNNLLAGTYGLGTGRYHDPGDWVFAPLQGPKPSLLLMDIKQEQKFIVDNAKPDEKKLVNNPFPGFNVDNKNDGKDGKLRKVEFDGSEDGVPFVDPRDTALIRNYTAKDHKIRGRDLAFVADGAGGLKIVLVTARDGAQIAKTERRTELADAGKDPDATAESIRVNLGPTLRLGDSPTNIGSLATTNAQGVDVVSSDLSDEFVYVADGQAGIKVVRIHEIFTAGPQIVGQVDTPGFANKVRIEGNFLFVADGPAGLTVVDVTNRNNPVIVKTINTGGDARDIAVYGVFAFIANGNNGMAVVDISNESNPKFVTTFNPGGVINDARGLDYADNRVYLADGQNGMRIIDIAVPAKPELLLTVNRDENGKLIDDAESVAMATVPFRTFAMLSDGRNGLHAINVTDFRDIRERLFAVNGTPSSAFNLSAADAAVEKAFQNHFNLTLALRDPLTPFDRANLKFATINGVRQVNNPQFQIITFPVSANQRLLRIARGRQLDKLGDSSGRTLRDSTAVGAGAVSRAEIDKMRNVNVAVQPGTPDEDGNGLGNIVFQSLSSSSNGATISQATTQEHHLRKERETVSANRSLDQNFGIAAMMMTMMTAIAISRFRYRRKNKQSNKQAQV
jgi:LVIVD repeat-containing protein